MITDALLSRIVMCPLPLARRWTVPLNEAMQRFDITTSLRVGHFLAQIGHESSSLQVLQENLSYSQKRIGEAFGRHIAEADQPRYVRKPEKLANRVYAYCNGNHDEDSGDGYRYRGRGLIALSGRDNYRHIGTVLDLPLEDQPDLLASPEVGALAAAAGWQDAGLNALADRDDVLGISRHINLGSAANKATPEGMADRFARTERAKVALGLGVGVNGLQTA